MKVFAIVSEYNPFHKGHKYQIECIKKDFPDAYIISITSGSFVQRGEASFIFKHSKAEHAVLNGVDLVIELPTIISLQSADYFSHYSVDLLNKINIVDKLCFSVENTRHIDFLNLVNHVNSHKYQIDNLLMKKINEGLSYKMAYKESLYDLCLDDKGILSYPNNILGKKYIDSLNMLKSNMTPYIIERQGPGYHTISDNELYESATSLRERYDSSSNFDIIKNLGFNLESINKDRLDKFSSIFYYLAFIKKKPANQIAGFENGILNLLIKNYDGLISSTVEKSHNKRYSKSRLRRFIINYILGITQDDVNKLGQINYIKPIKYNDKGRALLKMIKENSDIKIVSKERDIDLLDEYNRYIWEIDKKAFFLANIDNINNNIKHYIHNPYLK